MRALLLTAVLSLVACGAQRGGGDGGVEGAGDGAGDGGLDGGEERGGPSGTACPEGGDPLDCPDGGVDGGADGDGDGGGQGGGDDGDGGAGADGGDDGDGGGQGGGDDGDGGQDGGDDGAPPVVHSAQRLTPNEGSFEGGTEVRLIGRGLQDVLEIKVDGRVSVILERQDRSLIFKTPWGNPGPASVTVHFEGELKTLDRTYRYLGPALDGVVSEWREAWWIPHPDEAVELPDNQSGLVRMAAVSDGPTLYVAIIGFARQDAAIVGYVDLDPGEGTGLKQMSEINPAGGELDAALSNRVRAEGGLGAELGFGTVGMWSSPLEGAPQAGWRDLADPDNPVWMRGALNAVVADQTIETSVALPPAVAGTQIAVAVRIVTADGRQLSNQTLPPDNPALPSKWSQSYLVQVPER